MQLLPYSFEELRFAWCNRIFVRCRTHRIKPIEALSELTSKILGELLEPYGINVLELATTSTEFQAMLSLTPTESASTAASKSKGRISKWLTDHQSKSNSDTKLARGYFALTLGEPDSKSVNDYLEKQSEHHGYDQRVRPPIFMQSFHYDNEKRKELATDHASTLLRYHVVLATWHRHGIFIDETARCITERWLELHDGFLIDKVSIVPDHVHIALTLHPTQSPINVVAALMNTSQDLMWDRFPNVVIKASVERLWQPSAYIGSYGALSSKAIKAYMHRWASRVE